MDEEAVVGGVSKWCCWWIEQRKRKLRDHLTETMSVNPFLLPILYDLHSVEEFSDLGTLLVSGHLMVGHSTGFGKLIDEKILPNVFNTKKLDKKYRKENPPLIEACFNEIDHIVQRQDGTADFLSLKAGKWTIQLTMAQQLNTSFCEIINGHSNLFGKIAVGVFYGKRELLTDKYDILRGINRGAQHDVVDITDRVDVYAGREFWSWLNNGEEKTQEWVLKGLLDGVKSSNARAEGGKLLDSFTKQVAGEYDKFKNDSGGIDWLKFLEHING